MYVGILRGGDSIAEHGGDKASRNFARAISVTAKNPKMSFTHEQLAGHSSKMENGDLIVVICELDRPRRKAFSLIQSIEKKAVESAPKDAVESAVAEFTWDDPITNAQADIDQVRTTMIQNVDKILERGDRINLLVDRTQELSTGSHSFRKQAAATRSRFWWRNVRMLALLLVFVAVLLALLYLFV